MRCELRLTFNWEDTMRKIILAAATFAALASVLPAQAQDATLGGAVVGAGAGAVIGGAVTHGNPGGVAAGAVIGGTTGAAIGAQAEPRYRERVCFEDHWGHRRCHWRYR
jgi:uncharacterized protein YcfJ